MIKKYYCVTLSEIWTKASLKRFKKCAIVGAGFYLHRLSKWSKILFLTLFSLEIIVLAFLGMYAAWKLTITVGGLIEAVATIFGGIVGFAVGAIIFWSFSIKLSKVKGDLNCPHSQS